MKVDLRLDDLELGSTIRITRKSRGERQTFIAELSNVQAIRDGWYFGYRPRAISHYGAFGYARYMRKGASVTRWAQTHGTVERIEYAEPKGNGSNECDWLEVVA